MFKKITIIIFSSLLGLLLFEFLYKNLKFDKVSEQYNDLLKIYSLWTDKNKTGGRLNIENKIWTYDKNNEFHHRLFVKTNDGWLEEFSYRHNSNNFGLNQETNIIKNKKSILFLGASSPEGWGGNPWFNELNNEFKTNYQLIHGNLHGTGVFSWRILHDYLKNQNIKIEKIFIIIHGDFWVNVSKTIPKAQIDCLKDYKNCLNTTSSFFFQYGMPNNANEGEIIKYLNDIDKIRNLSISQKVKNVSSFKEFLFYLREMLPATYQIYRFARIQYNKRLNKKELSNFIKEYGDDLIIFHLPQQIEYTNAKLTQDSLSLMKFIKKKGGNLFNSYEECERHVSEDYYFYEGHPNLKGYKKIKDCSKKALKVLISK
tara:strand:- start:259 stop:1371 length:1113 start_codon:yes stop_codon:yes gene_type:complete